MTYFTPTGNAANDPMKDGLGNGFATDAFGMQLEYFPNDYVRQNSNVTDIPTGTQNYFNGNVTGISWQSNKTTTAISTEPTGTNIQAPNMYTYTYDPKYQYTGATLGTPAFTGSQGTFAAATNNMLQEKGISYDFNGNITGMQHTGPTGTPTDNFTYNYTTNTNKLASVANAVTSSNYGTYTYDQTGRLSSQTNALGTTYVQYDVTGKITGIYKAANFTSPVVTYAYDESGNRITSTNYTGTQTITTYYVYDAGGNVMAIYTQTGTATPVEAEVPVYGSSRLGTYFVAGASYVYELRDNVGSVRVAITGTKVNSQASIYKFDDYYPYGSIAQSGGSSYRYDYQGAYSEKDAVTGYNNFELRMYDGKIGRWLSVDPMGQYSSPYEGMGNNPSNAMDIDGGLIIFVNGMYWLPGYDGPNENYWQGVDVGFENYFNDKHVIYADGTVGGLIASNRTKAGIIWSKENLNAIAIAKKNGEKIIIVTHSLGTAYGIGINNGLEAKNIKPDLLIALSPFQNKLWDSNLNAGDVRTLQFNNRGDFLKTTLNQIDGKNVSRHIRDGGGHMQWEYNWIWPDITHDLDPKTMKGYVNGSQVPFSDDKDAN